MLVRRNELGRVRVNKAVVAEMLADGLKLTGGRMYLATEKGKIVASSKGKSIDSLSSSIVIYDEKDRLAIRCFAVTKFGCSIKALTNIMFDSMEPLVRDLAYGRKAEMTIKIVGVMAKNTVHRNYIVHREYI